MLASAFEVFQLKSFSDPKVIRGISTIMDGAVAQVWRLEATFQ